MEVLADRETHRVVEVAHAAQRRERTWWRRPPRRHDPLRADLLGLAVALRDETRHHAACRRVGSTPGSVKDLRARGFGVVEHDLVEVLARLDQAVSRPSRRARGTSSSRVRPAAWTRSPSTRSQVRSSSPRPISSRTLTARGVRPSPQVFSRGNVFFSQTSTEWPRARGSERPPTRTAPADDGDVDLGRQGGYLPSSRLVKTFTSGAPILYPPQTPPGAGPRYSEVAVPFMLGWMSHWK